MTVRCAIVDDEPLARRNLEALLGSRDGFESLWSLGDSERALRLLLSDPVDLVFLDVRMPELNGIQLLAELTKRLDVARRPYVILVTAFDRYALQAFEYDALDYLVKPFDTARFEQSLARAEERLAWRRAGPPSAAGASRPPLAFKTSGGELFLRPEEVCWVEACDHYLMIHARGRTHLVRQTMQAMEDLLADHGFLRVHRGALVQMTAIAQRRALSDGGQELTLSEGSRVRVSRRRWPAVREALASR